MSLPKDSLGDRIKSQYEDRYRILLPRRTYTILRLDGKAFHSFTRWCTRPFDARLHDGLVNSVMQILPEIQGSRLAYLQSDEISILVTDLERIVTGAYFDGNLQKIVSVAASLMTAAFSRQFMEHDAPSFDCRAFIIPDPIEVVNYIIWRQKYAERNSIQMVAQAHFSPQQLHGKDCETMRQMLEECGDPWEAYPQRFRLGDVLLYPRKQHEAAWRFTEEREALRAAIPRHGYE